MKSFVNIELPTTTQRLTTLAIVSLLSDAPNRNAAERSFDGASVLATTVERIRAAEVAQDVVVLAWDDQLAAARAAVDDQATVETVGPRRALPWLDAATAALRWSDGWRGGLLGTCEFDRGYDGGILLRTLLDYDANAALLVSPAAVFIEPATLRSLADRLEADTEQPYAFAAGPVGAVAMLLRRTQIEELERGRRGPGSLLTYHPDRPTHDPLAKSLAVAVPSRVARTLTRVAPTSDRIARRVALALADDRDSLEQLVTALETDPALDPLPREITIDLTTRRATKPAWTVHASVTPEPIDLPLERAEQLFAEIAAFDGETRITFGGIGDPLLHPQLDAILAAARRAGLAALHVETDLLPDGPEAIDRLVNAGVDVISFHLPAATRGTYQRLMGVDRIGDVIAGVQRFLAARSRRAAGVPILVPTFVKCVDNFGEMEAWYDQWIRALGTAVIAAPSDMAGTIAFAGIDDLTPPSHRACRRLSNRIMIRSDGSIMPCEEACDPSYAVGRVGESSLASAWTGGLSMLRSLHDERRWDESALCRNCRMWDRP